MVNLHSGSASVVVEPVDLAVPVDSAAVSFGCATDPAILGSYLQGENYGRFSILACDPVDVFCVSRHRSGCPFRALRDHVARYPGVSGPATGLPFVGGWIGFITYEAGLSIERIECTTRPEPLLPLLRFCLYDSAVIYDQKAMQWYLVAVDWPTPLARSRPPVKERIADLRTRLQDAATVDPPTPPQISASAPPVPNMSYEAYLAKVARAKQYITTGDIYQVNLTQRFTTETDAPPLDVYRRLCRSSPSPHSAFLQWGNTAVVSCSPELFLKLSDGHVITRPIKGTRPRVGHAPVDTAYRRELIESEKDRAELTMIIDLLRNDLGRVCSFGSVRVTSADEIEEHPTVFHRVATIEGDLRPQHDWLDLLLATFPGGSITGAPKIRAMQIINELEPTARGVYCGSIGMIGLDGSMSLNIAIRTMIQLGSIVQLYAGGAIVADSTPEEEYNEIIAKATGMLRALGCEAPARSTLVQEMTVP